MMNTHLFLTPYKILQSKKYEVSLIGGGYHRGPIVRLTQVSSGKVTSLSTLSLRLRTYLGYLETPFNPFNVKAALDNFFAITDRGALNNIDALEKFLQKEILNNINLGSIQYDVQANQAILKAFNFGVNSGLVRIFCQQAAYGIYDKKLYDFLEVLYTSKFIENLVTNRRMQFIDRVLPPESLITDSGYMALYVKADSQGYLLGENEEPTLFNLTKPGLFSVPNTPMQAYSRISLDDPVGQSVWKVLVDPRDISLIDIGEVVYVDKFIPVKEIADFKDRALLYNISADRITAFLKKVPKHAVPSADYIPPEPCYWGIEYYDDRNKEQPAVPCGVADQS